MAQEFVFTGISTSGWWDREQWLWDNLGPGGSWLCADEPAQGDRWGTYIKHGRMTVCILDPQEAALFALRWS